MIEGFCWVDCHPLSVANALDGEACLNPQSIVLPFDRLQIWHDYD